MSTTGEPTCRSAAAQPKSGSSRVSGLAVCSATWGEYTSGPDPSGQTMPSSPLTVPRSLASSSPTRANLGQRLSALAGSSFHEPLTMLGLALNCRHADF
eukprot:UN2485